MRAFFRKPAPKALLTQIVAAGLALFFWKTVPLLTQTGVGLWLLPVLWGTLAAILGVGLFSLPVWWSFINFFFPLALFIASGLALPAWVYLVAFILCLAVFWNVGSERVPLYLTNRKTWEGLSELLPDKEGFSFVDIGSGIGGTLMYLARKHPRGQFTGVENAPVPYVISWLWQKISRSPNITCRYGDYWQMDFSSQDVIYCFLSPEPMPRVYEKAARELKSGALLISNSFDVPDHPPHQVIQLNDQRKTRLLIWKF
ncbi:class I SAM-dependent methyltransferase [Kiloniella laminariae]|uniref:Class I SAM-dependent methyltransferase n=1 Tax=Kiloniella laminariae TaxID=454162 RepID=A0ABT4LNL5_9PROT|nr:class I SAM-dependent methyltransferase [Kiloniella laminariae]MCZ4282745.1 class I SAM-dependent methyltransferase [Kiloniella laminariae]